MNKKPTKPQQLIVTQVKDKQAPFLVVHLEGGLITSVESNVPELQCMVIDKDDDANEPVVISQITATAAQGTSIIDQNGHSLFDHVRFNDLPFDYHESDLYLLDTPQARELLKAYPIHQKNATMFVSVVGEAWIDIPFAYDPWWEMKTNRKEAP